MLSKYRTVWKALTWQASGLIVMTAIGYAMTGSLQTGGEFALITAGISFVTYLIHEKLWQRVG
ncbi:MAG: DUF2061 domain-containing protein [Pseudomonadota bacterium]